jgi:hypothetical protein
MIGRFFALIGYRRPTAPPSALPLDDSTPGTAPADAGAWDALLGPDQPIPPLGLLPPPAQPDRVATMRLVARLRQACGLEGGR